MKIADVKATPTSFPVPPEASVTLGIGRTVKRDAVVVKVTADDGRVGWGEAHHGRAPGAVAHLVNTTLRQLVLGQDAMDAVGVWQRVYTKQLGSHGMGAGAAIALSGVDMALWDLRGKALGAPLYRLLGGGARPIPAYAGGVSLGWQEPAKLVDEARALVGQGYRALKLRLGDTPRRDLERVAAVRKALGDELVILTDANTGYTVADARAAIPGLDAHGVGWLEEPFPAHDHRSYALAATFGRVPLAAGENHYTRFEFTRVIEDRVITILQPDLAKTGGITEALRIAALASAWKLPIHPHTSMTGL
ncbi:MAG: mandelate racemase/muconate lactonizing enzyme family protein, partial [Candidatus Rokubacteria bacterium]|nr:mandelate racemase/muconate lactonizing enzyme family protein [Candidatus Rokubacteria bacterium]